VKKGFVIYNDSLSVLNKLTDEQAGKLFKTIASYHKDGSLPEDNLISIVFEPFLNQFVRDGEKYSAVCKQNSEAVKLRWEKKGKNKKKNEQKEPSEKQVKVEKEKNILLHDFLVQKLLEENDTRSPEDTAPNDFYNAWEKRNGADSEEAFTAKYLNFYKYWTGKGDKKPTDPYKIDWLKTWINYIERK
jgi:hypothetical protein